MENETDCCEKCEKPYTKDNPICNGIGEYEYVCLSCYTSHADYEYESMKEDCYGK